MQSCEARFVAMFMDRLQGLEIQVTALQEQNVALTDELATVQRTLHLEEDLYTFSDGYQLLPDFGDGKTTTVQSPDTCCINSWRDLPLDALHANATAWYGKMKFDLSCCEAGQTLTIGEVQKHVTVQEFVDAVHNWAVAWDKQQTPPAIDAAFVMYDCMGYIGWNTGRCDKQDDGTICTLK